MYLAFEATSRETQGSSQRCLRIAAGSGIPERAGRTRETEGSRGATGAPAARTGMAAEEIPGVPLGKGPARGDAPRIDDEEVEA